jgi:hypothetical protein
MLASLASVSISVTNVLAVETSERLVHRALMARMAEALEATLHPDATSCSRAAAEKNLIRNTVCPLTCRLARRPIARTVDVWSVRPRNGRCLRRSQGRRPRMTLMNRTTTRLALRTRTILAPCPSFCTRFRGKYPLRCLSTYFAAPAPLKRSRRAPSRQSRGPTRA